MYKNFKHIQNVSEDGESATMLLNKRIGNAYDDKGNLTEVGIYGHDFANEMLYLRACTNVKNIDVHINSIGGDVLDGYNIVDAIMTHKANTHTVFAASMAGLCAIAGEKRTIADYGSFMGHEVSGGGEDQKKVRGIIQDSLKTLFMGRTKMNGDTIDNLFKAGTETWFSNSKNADYSLKDAVKFGLFDEIVSTKRKFDNLKSLPKNSIELAKFYNSITTETKSTMIKVTAVLGLKNEAAEEAIVSAIETIKAENAAKILELNTANAKATELQNKLDAIENAAKAEKTAKAKAAVDKGIADGKIKEDQRANMMTLAETNLEAFNALVATAPNMKQSVKMEYGKGEGAKNAGEDRAAWDYIKWSKEDPEGLKNMKNETPEVYQALLEKLSKSKKK